MSRKGYILLEATIAYVILALVLVSLVPILVVSVRANETARRMAVAAQLSSELLDEVGLRRWDQSTPLPPRATQTRSALGLDPGETSGDKRTFDDIDDFDGWREAPPTDPAMRPLEGLESFTREVSVSYVDDDWNRSKTPTNLKEVTVCTSLKGLTPVCLSKVFANR